MHAVQMTVDNTSSLSMNICKMYPILDTILIFVMTQILQLPLQYATRTLGLKNISVWKYKNYTYNYNNYYTIE